MKSEAEIREMIATYKKEYEAASAQQAQATSIAEMMERRKLELSGAINALSELLPQPAQQPAGAPKADLEGPAG